MKRMLWLLLFAVMLAAPVAAMAEGSISATLRVNSNHITVGDVVPLTVSVTHPAGWRVIFPTLEKKWGDFEVRSQAAPQIEANADGTETTTQEIDVARMRPGTTATPLLSVSVADDQGKLQKVDVAPVQVEVQSVLVKGDEELRDIKPQAELMVEQNTYLPLASVILLGVGALAFYVVRRWRHRPLKDKRTPRERALDTLKEIETQNLTAQSDIKTYCTRVADCLRDYLAVACQIPARDLTTSEIARGLKASAIPANLHANLIQVLRVCDGVKFANEVANPEALKGLISMVRPFVESYPPAPAPAKVRTRRGKQVEVAA